MEKYLFNTDFLIKFSNTKYLFNLQYNIRENNIFSILINISLQKYIPVLYFILVNEKQFQHFSIDFFFIRILPNIIILYTFKEY